MTTRTQAFVLLLFGGVLARLATGTSLLNYVRPVARPWVLIAGLSIMILAIAQLVIGYRSRTDAEPASRNGWLVLVPVVLLLLLAPPALGAFTVKHDVVSAPPKPNAGFSALSGPLPHRLKLGDFVVRVLWDSGRTVTGQDLAIDGFVVAQRSDGFVLARLLITCCAADARPLEVFIRSSQHPPVDSWVTATGTYAGVDAKVADVPVLIAHGVRRIAVPSNPYD